MDTKPLTSLTLTERNRFWNKVDKNGPNGCWLWTGYVVPDTGYGQVGFRYKLYLTHRASWLIHGRTIPSNMLVCHHCDNRVCVNPNHLFVGTQLDNMRDMIAKGRAIHSNNLRGESTGTSKLTEQQVIEIRMLHQKEGLGQRRLAKRFNVTPQNIYYILKRKSWTHI